MHQSLFVINRLLHSNHCFGSAHTIDIINLKDDEVAFLDDLNGEKQEDIENEMQQLIEKATAFYDAEMENYE